MKAILIVIIVATGYSPHVKEYPMETMDLCLRVLKESKAFYPQKADDNEGAMGFTCAMVPAK